MIAIVVVVVVVVIVVLSPVKAAAILAGLMSLVRNCSSHPAHADLSTPMRIVHTMGFKHGKRGGSLPIQSVPSILRVPSPTQNFLLKEGCPVPGAREPIQTRAFQRLEGSQRLPPLANTHSLVPSDSPHEMESGK